MNSDGSDGQTEIFQLLIAALMLVALFVLLRPPTLMLLSYGFGFDFGGVADRTSAAHGEEEAVWQARRRDEPTPIQPPGLPQSLSSDQPPGRWSVSLAVSEDMRLLSDGILSLANQERAARDLSLLSEDPSLVEIAARHSKDMVVNNYLAHESLDGDGPAQRVGVMNRTLFGLTRENVALASSPAPSTVDDLAAQFNSQWMNSLGHRRNMLSQDSNLLGVGCFEGPDSKIAGNTMRKCTQLFMTAVAQSESAIPLEVNVGQTIPLRISPFAGQPLPVAVVQTDLATGRAVPGQSAQFAERGGIAEAQLRVVGPPGTYGLAVHVPLNDGTGRYSVVPGPYVRVQ